MTKLLSSRVVGWSAMLSGIIDFIGFTFVLLFFALEAPHILEVGEPGFPPLSGILNDTSFILVTLFMIPTALALRRMERSRAALSSGATLAVGLIGMLATAVVQALYLPRIVQTALQAPLLNIALGIFGLWIVLSNALARDSSALPGGVTWLGIIVGVSIILLPVTYFVAGGSALLGDPSSATSNPLVTIGLTIGSLGVSVGYAIWAILLGRLVVRGTIVLAG